MSKITIKSEYETDLRRFPVNTKITFKELVETVTKLYRLVGIRLKYKDEEGDQISITNDEELQEAFAFATNNNNNLLRLMVTQGPKLEDSWVVVGEVRDICNDIKTLSNQLLKNDGDNNKDPAVNNNNNNNNENAPQLSPTAQHYSSTNQPNNSTQQQPVLLGQLPSWGKNSMYAGEVVTHGNEENNNDNNNKATPNDNNNNNNNANLMEVARTDLPVQKPSSKISQMVSENSVAIVKDLKVLTSKIASLVIQSAAIPLDVKDDLIQTNMKLAEMTIANCAIQSNNAIETCNQSSALALNVVNSALADQKKQNVQCDEAKKQLNEVCDTLRHDTVLNCSSLSDATVENCLKGANSIRDLIMNL